MNFKVVGIPEKIAFEVRETMRSPQYGHPAFAEPAKGYGPCRSCLRRFDTNRDERVLFTYNAFEGLSSLPLPGPVFVHKSACERYERNEFPIELRKLPIALEAFGAESRLVAREKVDDSNIEQKIEELFSASDVDYIHVRNTEAGCFMARIERGSGS